MSFLEKARRYADGTVWEVWTGCSWRRVGIKGTQETVIEPCVADDGHPDLRSRAGIDEAVFVHNLLPELLAVVKAAKSR
jgi:hypothetical protein